MYLPWGRVIYPERIIHFILKLYRVFQEFNFILFYESQKSQPASSIKICNLNVHFIVAQNSNMT